MSIEWTGEMNRRDREAARVAWEAANPNEPYADPREIRLHVLLDELGSTFARSTVVDNLRADAELIKAYPVRMAELSARLDSASEAARRRVLREYVDEEDADEESAEPTV